MKVLLAIPVCALLAATAVGPRTIVVHGRITDAADGAPLSGVQVVITELQRGTLTGADGAYRLALPAGLRGTRATLVAQLIGYGSAGQAVVLAGDSVRADFALHRAAVQLDELSVTTASGDVRRAAAPPPADAQHAGAPIIADAAMPDVRQRAAGSARVRMEAAAQPGGWPGEGYRARREPWNTESYAAIEENEFQSVRANPLSTFSIDVDRASYSNIRRYLTQGQLPPKDAVRIEEMVNYFPYRMAEPRGDAPFAVTTEVMRAPWQRQHQLVRISLQAPRVDLRDLPPNNLVFLLDVSGSMNSPDKLPLLKRALRLLVNELREQDRVAIVVYAGSAGLVLPSTPGSDKERILDAIERLEAGGSTAGGAGLRLAYQVAREHHIRRGNNRVILATDGDFNVGVSSDAEMIRLIEERRGQGTFLTVLGFGTGNLKDSKMEALADHGNGNYAYIDDLPEARKVLVSELGGTLLTVAKDVKLQVEFNPAHVRAYRLIGYENRLLAAEDFDDDRKDAGELGAGHAVTALYEVVPAGVHGTVEVREPGDLRYQRPRGDAQPDAASWSGDGIDAGDDGAAGGVARDERARRAPELAWVKLRYKEPTGTRSRLLEVPVALRTGRGSDDMRFAAAVAAFGMLLRGSEHSGSAGYGEVIALARGALGEDESGYRAELVRMVEVARRLTSLTADAFEQD